MRSLALALVGLAVHALAHSALPTRRKTLGFGSDLPHARFESVDAPAFAALDASKDAFSIAREFLSQYDHPEAGRTYVVRPDSYTDHATGVTHVYARQIIGGIEVANAHVNLNIKGGRVLSVGDSFFAGVVEQDARVPVHPHAQHCARLASALDAHRVLVQSPLAARDRARAVDGLAHLVHAHASACARVPALATLAGGSAEVDLDPRRALLAFLATALPEDHSAFGTFEDRLEDYARAIAMTPETHRIGVHVSPGMSLSNVPGAVGDVKARVVWMQVPTAHGVQLELVHRFEVEMARNWYEITVTTSVPHRIVSVVDWVSDAPVRTQIIEDDGRLPNLAAFVLPESFDAVVSAPAEGRGHKMGDIVAGKKRVSQPPEPHKASYLVFPWGTNDPVEAAQKKAVRRGEPAGVEYPLSYGRELMKELGDALASPAGWHTLPFSHDPSVSSMGKTTSGSSDWRTTDTTWGNNVFAQENWRVDHDWIHNDRPSVRSDGTFSYPYSPRPADTKSESVEAAKSYINASLTQLFYTSNMVHDLFYRYGFTEVAGNFQQYNFGRGGEEGDGVIADAQDGDGFNNAAFATPPDGQHGRCRMFLWDTGSPYPDGVMEADIVIHELSHGLSTRITGGPKNSGCLGTTEAGGMGEGWGDFIAASVRSISIYSDYAMGTWASNRRGGVRNYPYSTDPSVNPSTYKTLDEPGFLALHAIGEVWAEMLWIVQQRLIAKHGFSNTLLPPAPAVDGVLPPNDFYRSQTFDSRTELPNPLVPKHGNTLSLQLVINGMKMQPCFPSFFDARDAIIEADKVLTGGENVCDIWHGFAERGLGVDAGIIGKLPWDKIVRTNGFNVPAECRSGEREPGSASQLMGNSNPRGLWYVFEHHIKKWIAMVFWRYDYRF